MPYDPFYEKMTPQYKVKQKLIEAWPSIYKFINHIFFTLLNALIGMIKSVRNVF